MEYVLTVQQDILHVPQKTLQLAHLAKRDIS